MTQIVAGFQELGNQQRAVMAGSRIYYLLEP